MTEWIEYLGRLHVMIVHFPIGLLVTSALVEFVGVCRRLERPMTTSVVLVWCGAFAAAVAAVQGWIMAGDSKHPGAEDLVELHRWAGVTTAVLAALAAGAGLFALRGRRIFRWPFRILIFVTAISVAVAAHWGGSLIYGEGYFAPPGYGAAEQTDGDQEPHSIHSPESRGIQSPEPHENHSH